jgi:nicotinamidase-related amidase
MLLSSPRSLLLVVDIQERLAPAVQGLDRLLANLGILLAAAHRLGVPVVASEQYPKGLGRTLPAIAAQLAAPGASPEVFEKAHFSCASAPGFTERLAEFGRPQIVIVGIEAHICVLQTAIELRAGGWNCFVVADACASRTVANAELGQARMLQNGVEVVSTEMVLFEWLHQAGTPAFKALSALVR